MNSLKSKFEIVDDDFSHIKSKSQFRGYNDECQPYVKASSLSPFQFMAFAAITISTIINIVNAINNNNNNNDNNNNNNLVRRKELVFIILYSFKLNEKFTSIRKSFYSIQDAINMNTGMRRKRAMNQDKSTWSFLNVGEKLQSLYLTSIPQNIDANDKT